MDICWGGYIMITNNITLYQYHWEGCRLDVYIEYVIIDNLIINYILLTLANKLCNASVSKKRLIVADIVGTTAVVFMPWIGNISYLLLLYRFGVAILMCLVLKRWDFAKYISFLLTFVTITFLFGGFLIATLSIFDIVYTTSGLLFLNFEIPLSLFVVPIWIYSVLVNKIYHFVISKIRYSKLTYNATIYTASGHYNLTAFLDTGNELTDSDGSPVLVMELKTFCRVFKDFPLQKLLMNGVDDNLLEGAHYINVDTVNRKEKMLVFRVEKLVLHNTAGDSSYNNVMVGISRRNFNDYNLILHKNLCG